MQYSKTIKGERWYWYGWSRYKPTHIATSQRTKRSKLFNKRVIVESGLSKYPGEKFMGYNTWYRPKRKLK